MEKEMEIVVDMRVNRLELIARMKAQIEYLEIAVSKIKEAVNDLEDLDE
ncbi:MAG: hypothetical protein FWE01_00130 [Firmicutes bacterium]|nr:hypothetical protein [Bacillota bacterium]